MPGQVTRSTAALQGQHPLSIQEEDDGFGVSAQRSRSPVFGPAPQPNKDSTLGDEQSRAAMTAEEDTLKKQTANATAGFKQDRAAPLPSQEEGKDKKDVKSNGKDQGKKDKKQPEASGSSIALFFIWLFAMLISKTRKQVKKKVDNWKKAQKDGQPLGKRIQSVQQRKASLQQSRNKLSGEVNQRQAQLQRKMADKGYNSLSAKDQNEFSAAYAQADGPMKQSMERDMADRGIKGLSVTEKSQYDHAVRQIDGMRQDVQGADKAIKQMDASIDADKAAYKEATGDDYKEPAKPAADSDVVEEDHVVDREADEEYAEEMREYNAQHALGSRPDIMEYDGEGMEMQDVKSWSSRATPEERREENEADEVVDGQRDGPATPDDGVGTAVPAKSRTTDDEERLGEDVTHTVEESVTNAL